MRAFFIFVTLLATGCKGGAEQTKHGPALTPLVANQLKALAGECEVRAAKGEAGTKELRLCKGRQAMMTIHLDEHRNLRQLEIGLWAPLFDEAKQLVELTLRGIVSDAALAAATERMRKPQAEPVVVDGVRVNAFATQAANENPRYTVTLAW